MPSRCQSHPGDCSQENPNFAKVESTERGKMWGDIHPVETEGKNGKCGVKSK